MEKQVAQGEEEDHHIYADVSMDAGNEVEAAQSAENQRKGGTEDITPAYSDANARIEPSINTLNDEEDASDDDEFAVRFSAAQLKAKIAQAKYEAKLAADVELLEAKKQLVERRYEVVDRERERDRASAQCKALQTRLDAVLQEHKQTLCGMREDLQLEKLLVSLDVEKATLKKLREAFEKQQQTLTLAQERVEELDVQVANYQKTETVMAQSVSHLQHRFTSKDQQRAASVKHIQRELMEQHELEVKALREELAIARSTEQMAQGQLQELQKELQTLRDSAQQALASQESVVTREHELQAKISQLEAEKAMLQSKAEQVQKADSQLRSQVHAQSEEIVALRQEKETLQRDNKNLGDIASDLVQMADKKRPRLSLG
ncbi:hypothetical protein KRP22_002620 [Phytophthora ramorum]|nr:hypothetical protein KRP22_6267 [Phytophthora ramorum]